MSAITETEPGGEMVCIVAFSARPRDSDNRPLAGPRRGLRVGEHVRSLDSFFKDSPTDNPTGYMVVFEPRDREGRFVATRLLRLPRLLVRPRAILPGQGVGEKWQRHSSQSDEATRARRTPRPPVILVL